MKVFNKYPKSKESFTIWFLNEYNRYGHSYKTFLEAPYLQQCIVISRLFGYTIALEEYTDDQLNEHINNILYLYEEVVTKYPDGVPDYLDQIKRMSFAERTKILPELMIPVNIQHSLRESVVPLDANQVFSRVFISLRNSIIMIKPILPKEPGPEDDSYWTADKLNLLSNEVPF